MVFREVEGTSKTEDVKREKERKKVEFELKMSPLNMLVPETFQNCYETMPRESYKLGKDFIGIGGGFDGRKFEV